MSFNTSVNLINRRTSNRGQVVEILVDEDGDISDYSFSYPALKPDIGSQEFVYYCIYYHRPQHDQRSPFCNKYFTDAADAENYLIDQVFEPSIFSVNNVRNQRSYQLTS